jgi:hypothetical protein
VGGGMMGGEGIDPALGMMGGEANVDPGLGMGVGENMDGV